LNKENGKNEKEPAFLHYSSRERGRRSKKRIKLMNVLAMTRVESSQELSLIAGRLRATHRLSFADTWIAGTAIFYDAILVHKDPEFEQIEDKLKILKLPYKKRG
jgi:predicted nucleic acid-binding protein